MHCCGGGGGGRDDGAVGIQVAAASSGGGVRGGMGCGDGDRPCAENPEHPRSCHGDRNRDDYTRFRPWHHHPAAQCAGVDPHHGTRRSKSPQSAKKVRFRDFRELSRLQGWCENGTEVRAEPRQSRVVGRVRSGVPTAPPAALARVPPLLCGCGAIALLLRAAFSGPHSPVGDRDTRQPPPSDPPFHAGRSDWRRGLSHDRW